MIPEKKTIEAAYGRIQPYIQRTPIMTSAGVDEMAGCKLFFKCENFQKIGAFKARGAMNAALQLPPQQRSKGLATHSSGNHAQAVARAAKILGIKSYIVMPNNSSEMKRRGVLGYGGEIFLCEPNLRAREETLHGIINKTGAAEIHPFNNYEVIAGQATVAKELIEDVRDLDVIVSPVGGGGLLSGTALTVKFFSPTTKVIGAEPEGADDAFRSMQSGKIEPAAVNSVADGLLTSLGEKTFNIIKTEVAEIITASDKEIVAAMRLIWERLKIVIEPSAAVPLAVVLKSKEKFFGARVGIILSGGNVDLEKACELFNKYR
ncbi:pyridoxal-phosphate dependent enzyme [Chryseolinea sp. H1M3-3]|uniref:pyridoxal-phosphate dependent enzyme n=1 Tax=Chryseolinea sp. H1M3-3 TaxID=3034144 RepID=UPI0023EAE777|nr:pyridoxal-phosphate dependent enzyme [Chryseolinea sp. H1M3-3]